ncbi:hypothetical protein BQ8794_110164 [Mesorhizobium prunaredense]|uniref:Uncharacterized protein n=1 Tax=Mesorhizobium prunaredense TaxID=1631249 RepID=A0A1R3V0F8_9HYPH|nr:hypothetical protein BQ8794_110164 [Mesorhizobium prunaredense]
MDLQQVQSSTILETPQRYVDPSTGDVICYADNRIQKLARRRIPPGDSPGRALVQVIRSASSAYQLSTAGGRWNQPAMADAALPPDTPVRRRLFPIAGQRHLGQTIRCVARSERANDATAYNGRPCSPFD